MSTSECAATGQLSINGVNLSAGPAFFTPNLFDLWATFELRGSDRLLPGAVGVIPYRRRITVITHDVALLISGYTDYAGFPAAPRTACLEANIMYLRGTILTPNTTNPGTMPSLLTFPSGETMSCPVHVLKFQPGEVVAGWMQATLSISLPTGRYVIA